MNKTFDNMVLFIAQGGVSGRMPVAPGTAGTASRIKKLTSVAEKISVGEMDAEIPVSSRDEIGDLAEAIGRMQESIRLSIERLRRRR